MHTSEFDENGIARLNNNGKWCLVNRKKEQISEWYSYIEQWGEGYYKAEMGIKKNILRPDGSVVLKEWHNDVYKVTGGFFMFSNTIRKSKTNPKTKYIYGLAHVSGVVVFPMLFDRMRWLERNEELYAEINEKPYILTLEGVIYDPAGDHLPKNFSLDHVGLFEKFLNWTMPGLQFFYRDTDAPVIVGTTYHPGDIIRAGAFIDVTTKLLKPAHRTRFLIASAHAAQLFEIDDICENNPKVREWRLCTLHFNSYFKVMDVYEKDGVTQVFLLHIPHAAAFFLGHNETAFVFADGAGGDETSLISMARQSLDEKMSMDVHPRSLDQEFTARMYHPVGLDEEFYPVDLNMMDEPQDEKIASISSMIHKLAQDDDISDFIEITDNFPYKGVEKSVCEGCIYARGIKGNGEGCGRLFINSFRNKYLKGYCEYYKSDLSTPSEFEERSAEEKRIAKETIEKQCDKYSLDLLRSFVDERLGGDIDKLKFYDFKDITDDRKYGDARVSTFPLDTMLMKAVVTLAFQDSWPSFTFESMEKHRYKASHINITNTLFGINFEDYYKNLDEFNVPEDLKNRAIKFGRIVNSIGNIMVLPHGLTMMRGSKPMGRGYVDVFLSEFHKMMTAEKKFSLKLYDAMGLKRKEAKEFPRSEESYIKLMKGMMLEDLHEENFAPKKIFKGIYSWEPGLSRDTYIEALTEYLDFCEVFVSKRADRIIEKLKRLLHN